MYLIWRMNTTAKGAKKNTSPNVIHLQYFEIIKEFHYLHYMKSARKNEGYSKYFYVYDVSYDL